MDTKTVILFIAHGSRRQAANQEIIEIAKALAEQSNHKVIACFLEIAQPDIPNALEDAAQKETRVIKILPYFLTEGRHVKEDIPRIISEKLATLNYSGKIEWIDYFGSHDQVKKLLSQLIQ
ncbi:MAG: CbiX/SirB N-terminal domain-containing protein [Deltaproteobacteria bacterium]|nr:CbiX/SirB N-terminal domain-containing protein [Deltaproteobacteria bacterium]